MTAFNLEHHLKDLPVTQAADIKAIMALPDDEDVRSQILLELVKGKPLDTAIRHARAHCARDSRWAGITPPKNAAYKETLCPNFSYLDNIHQGEDGDGMNLHERFTDPLFGVDPQDILELAQSRTAIFEDHVERGISAIGDSAAAWGRAMLKSGRRGQQIVKAQTDRTRGEFEFRKGGKGQGGLFGFDGEVA